MSCITSDGRLFDVFVSALKQYDDIMESDTPVHHDDMQDKISSCKSKLEAATHMVSMLDIFSKNEGIEELQSSSVPYFLLPAMLGQLTQNVTSSDRTQVLKLVQVYLTDFINRCNDYNVVDVKLPGASEGEPEDNVISTPNGSIQAMFNSRDKKIQRYKENKALEERISQMKARVLQGGVEEEDERKFYINLIKRHVNLALEALGNAEQEIELLKHGARMMSSPPEPEKEKPKMQAFIIARDEAQKKVFGLGYSSVPTMTLDEWYDKQVEQGVFDQQSGGGAESVSESGTLYKSKADKDDDVEDEEKLKKAREWDEFKDEHRRGSGNRMNMG